MPEFSDTGDYVPHENSEGFLAEKDNSRLSREFAKEKITFLQSLNEQYPPWDTANVSNENEDANVHAKIEELPSGAKKRLSWGIPLHTEALDISKFTMILPEIQMLSDQVYPTPGEEII